MNTLVLRLSYGRKLRVYVCVCACMCDCFVVSIKRDCSIHTNTRVRGECMIHACTRAATKSCSYILLDYINNINARVFVWYFARARVWQYVCTFARRRNLMYVRCTEACVRHVRAKCVRTRSHAEKILWWRNAKCRVRREKDIATIVNRIAYR